MTASKATAASELEAMGLVELAELHQHLDDKRQDWLIADRAESHKYRLKRDEVRTELRRREERERKLREAASSIFPDSGSYSWLALRAALAAYEEKNDGN